MDPKQVSAQEQREHSDPHEQTMAIPIPMLILVAVMVIFGIFYILAGDSSTPAQYGDQRTMKDLMARAAPVPGAAVDGAPIYTARCVSCHQANGAGLPGVFPPLAGSEWVTGKPELIAKILLHGVQGPLTVKGTAYNGAMPPFKDQVNDAEIAAVATYIRKQWGNAAPPVTAEIVAAARTETASRTEPWKGDAELAALK
jgi:mono/diheme cytochrome c family protein